MVEMGLTDVSVVVVISIISPGVREGFAVLVPT
jgi:hypothetical protein